MTDPASAPPPNGLPGELTRSLVSLRTQYAGRAPGTARTEIRGNVVTCVLVDAGNQPPAAYKSEAVEAVVRLTRQRVTSFTSRHDEETDVSTEVFTLEPSLRRGAPGLSRRRMGQDLPPFSARRSRAAMVGR